MRLYEFNQGSRGKTVDESEGMKILEKKCSKSWGLFMNKGLSLLRGMKMKGDYYHIDPSSSTRVSQNTENYYTFILDNSPLWSKYPKRSKSLICTNRKGKALSYGTVYRVFPYDNSNLAKAPYGDIWDSFTKTFPGYLGLGQVNYGLSDLFDIFNLENEFGSSRDFMDELQEVEFRLGDIDFDEFDEDDGGLHEALSDNDLFEYWRKSGSKPFYEWFIERFKPEKNDFMRTTDIKKVVKQTNDGNEVWTDGKCMMVGFQAAHYKKVELLG